MLNKIGIIGIILVGILVLGTSMVSAQMFGLDGFVKFSTNGTQCSGANVTITNDRTGETVYNITGWGGTNFEGYYLTGADEFPSGYQDGDNLTYYTTYPDGSPAWDNTTNYTIVQSAGSHTMNITLSPTGGSNASVTVYDGAITFGNLHLNDATNTDGGDTQIIGTTGASGNQLIEIKLNSSTVTSDNNFTVLTFVTGSPGADQLKCEFKGGDSVSYTALTPTYQNFDNSMAKDTNANLNIQLTMPSSVSTVSYYDTYQYEIIVRATLI